MSALSEPAAERRAGLNAVKLRALVRDHLGREPDASATTAAAYGAGAAMVVDGTAWVLIDAQPERGLGAALGWFLRQPHAERLAVIADAGTGVLSRRAALFGEPIDVWHPVDRVLVPAVPDPYPVVGEPDSTHLGFLDLIAAGGAEPSIEHGVVCGEVRGLEVCRVVVEPETQQVQLEVGVGAHDREAFLMLHGGRPPADSLAAVVNEVAQHRRVGAPPHPLNRLARERFLRWQVVDDPGRVGAAHLAVADPPVVRTNLKDPVPCVATGATDAGRPLVVVCSSGIDTDLVPFALDARAMLEPDAVLRIVVPPRDLTRLLTDTAALAARPVELVALDG